MKTDKPDYVEALKKTSSSDKIIQILEEAEADVNIGRNTFIKLQKVAIKCLKEMIVRY